MAAIRSPTIATGVTLMPISGNDTPASHGPGEEPVAATGPKRVIAAGLGNTRWPTTPATNARLPDRADVVQPVPGSPPGVRRAGHRQTAGEHRDDADDDLLRGRGHRRRASGGPADQSASEDLVTAVEHQRLARRRLVDRGLEPDAHDVLVACLDPCPVWVAVGPKLRLALGIRRRRRARDPGERGCLDGASTQRFARADDHGVRIVQELDDIARRRVGTRRLNPQSGALTHRDRTGGPRAARVPCRRTR